MIKIEFKCECMSRPAGVFVRERWPLEAIEDYMKSVVQEQLSFAHFMLSPTCVASKMDYVKIPISKDGGPIGTLTQEERNKQKL